MKIKFFMAALAVVAATAFLSAQTPKTDTKTTDTKTTNVKTNQAKKSCYVDANNNGVCDNYENKTCTTGNGKGMMDGSGKGNGKGCHQGKGNGHCHGCKANGNGHGANYVDANNNGVCDHREGK